MMGKLLEITGRDRNPKLFIKTLSSFFLFILSFYAE